MAALLALAAAPRWSAAQDVQPPPEEAQEIMEAPPAPVIPEAPQDEPVATPYPVDNFFFLYATEHPDHPDPAIYQDVQVELGLTTTGYIKPREGYPTTTIRLGDLPGLDQRNFYFSGLNAVFEAVVRRMVEMDLIGVYVSVDRDQIDPNLVDQRVDSNDLTVYLFTATVAEMRTLAFGERVPDEQRENNPLHQRIRDHSPMQPWSGEGPRSDLLRQSLLDNYLARLNRLPGRRVDAAVSAAEEQAGTVVLDFLVAENAPALFYFQISNTGTRDTDTIRERFGLTVNQLTNNDDTLSLEYVTANFDASHAVVGNYEAPVGDTDTLRWSVNGSWNEFTASDVGIANENFKGDSWNAGADLFWNIYQQREFFLDLYLGARWMYVNVENEIVNIQGDTNFFLPHVGLRFERRTSVVTTEGYVQIEGNLPDVADTDEDELNALGRLFVDDDWYVLQWDAKVSFYLEPLLNRAAWENIEDRASSTLAHELYFAFRGQYAFDYRLIPQAEQVIGGLYTVRGYDESIVAGDDTYVFTAEYRFHLPKSYPYNENPDTLFGRSFRRVPQEPYGSADWDLILRGFFDIGYASISDPLSFETDNETLMGAGVGAEFSLYRNINIRLDWGFALEDVENAKVDAGSNNLHVVATFIF